MNAALASQEQDGGAITGICSPLSLETQYAGQSINGFFQKCWRSHDLDHGG
jgi:hypothetical protein